jgi:hypothetical protein
MLSKTSPAQEYVISTFGTPSAGKPGILINGFMLTDSLTFVLFDSGTLTITEINLTNMTISGYISATTNEKTSSLLGKFTIPINPN